MQSLVEFKDTDVARWVFLDFEVRTLFVGGVRGVCPLSVRQGAASRAEHCADVWSGMCHLPHHPVHADASGRECGTLSSMMQNDGPAITRHAYNVHHIDSTMLESHGVPSQLDGMRQLVEFLEEQGRHGPTVLVAHNGFACDFKYLHHTLKRLGLRLPATVAHFVDSLRLARGVEWAARPPNFKLGTLYHVATGAALADAHDALADARALARMFMGLPCLWTARQSQVHAWSKFLEVEDVRQAAKDAALAQPSRNALDDSDTESASPIDSDGDSDGDSGHDEAKEAGEWTPVADGAGMDRAPEDLFASGWATAGLKHAARFLDLAPSAMFLKLLEPVESLLVEETNRYAAQKRAARRIRHFLSWCVERRQRPFADLPFERLGMRRWKKVTRAEMRGCLAFVLRCSVHSTPGQVHWDTAACMKMSPAEYERAMIGRHRYEQIKRYLHASDSARQPASGSANYDPAYKVARLLQAAVKSWNKHYDPGPVVSIDETLLNVFKGRYRHRLKIRSKRHKTGIKLYVATGVRPNYVVAVRVKCADHDRSSGCFEGTKVVLQLMEDAGLLDQHRTVVTDNWYTSVEALKALKARSTFCYGVLRATRVPAAARFTEAEQRQPRGFSKTVYNSNLDAMVVGWMDNKPRYCLSNATSSKCNHEVGRRVKGVGATTVKAPDTLRRYNWDMGGVDWVRPCCGCCGCCARARDLTLHRVLLRQVDAITANVSVGANMVRTRKWWKKVLWYIIDTMVANANVLFNQFGERRAARSPDGAPFTRLSRREFRAPGAGRVVLRGTGTCRGAEPSGAKPRAGASSRVVLRDTGTYRGAEPSGAKPRAGASSQARPLLGVLGLGGVAPDEVEVLAPGVPRQLAHVPPTTVLGQTRLFPGVPPQPWPVQGEAEGASFLRLPAEAAEPQRTQVRQ